MVRGKISVLIRSIGVGAVATVVDLLALTVLIEVVGLSARAANVPGLALGILVQFVGNKWFAFQDRSSEWVRQGGLFLAVEALGFALNLAVFDLLVRVGVHFSIARVLGTAGVYFTVCLPLWRLIFTGRRVIA